MIFSQATEIERAQRLLSGEIPLGSSVQAEVGPQGRSIIRWLGTKSHGAKFLKLLRQAGVDKNETNGLIAAATVSLLIPIFLVIVTGLPFLFVLAPLLLIALYLYLCARVFSRAESFERDYTAMLLALASSVRTGLDPLVALCDSHKLFSNESLVRRELENFRANIERGASEERAMAEFANTIAHPDVHLFKVAYMLSRREGSSLGECLERLVRVTRQRQSFRRKIKMAVASQRLSANAISICTIIIGVIQYTANPKGVLSTLSHPVGSKALALGIGLIVLGLVWMRKMASQKI